MPPSSLPTNYKIQYGAPNIESPYKINYGVPNIESPYKIKYGVPNIESPQDSIKDTPRDSIKDTPRDSIKDTPRDSIKDTPRDSIKENLNDPAKGKNNFSNPNGKGNNNPTLLEKRPYNPYYPNTDYTKLKSPKAPKALKKMLPLPTTDPVANVPIGGGFYRTPGEAASPFDCARWPSSFGCQKQNLNPNILDLLDWINPINPEIVIDSCNIGASIEFGLGPIRLPKHQIMWRKPECRKPPPPPPRTPAPPPPPKPPNWAKELPILLSSPGDYFLLFSSGVDLLPLNLERLDACDLNLVYGLFKIPKDAWQAIYTTAGINPQWDLINYPPAPYEQNSGDSSDAAKYWLYRKGVTQNLYRYGIYLNKKYVGQIKVWPYGTHPMLYGPGPALAVFCSWDFENVTVQAETFEGSGTVSDYPVEPRLNIPVWTNSNLIKVIHQKSRFECSDLPVPPPPEPPEPPGWRIPPPPPPPPPKKKKPKRKKGCNCMSCCSSNDQLLKAILKKLQETPQESEGIKKLLKVTAAEEILKGEMSVPEDFTNPQSGNKKLNNIPEAILWGAEQNYNMIGSFPLEIEIEDTDLVTEGNQGKKIEIRNLAEASAEILGSNLVSRTVEDANFNATMRLLAEMGAVRQTVTTTYYNVRGIIEYLGYSIADKINKIPMSFTPGADSVDKALKESQQDNISWENTDKINLQKVLKDLLWMAAAFKAQNFVQAGKWAAGKLGTYLGKKESTTTDGATKQEEFDQFLNELENEFNLGADNAQPYGRSFSERPRITQKNNTSDNTQG